MNTSSRFRVLVYHRIGREDSPDGLVVSRASFAEQMRRLRRLCSPMSLGRALAGLEGAPLPPRAVAVTFDDGYADTFESALPVLRRFGIPATVFVTTGYLDGSVALGGPGSRPLSWPALRALRRAGLEVGSHTVSHPNLLRCGTREAGRQIAASRRRLERELKAPVRLFAYPYGHARSFDASVREAVRRAGYRAAFTTLPGDNGPGRDPFALRRVSWGKDRARSFALELDRLARGASGPGGIRGAHARALRLWRERYGDLGRRLKPDETFGWRVEPRGR